MISIIAEDSMQQSAEIIVDVIVANWASKDWAKCVSEFESGWIEWKYNFKLGDNKSWYHENSYYPESAKELYNIYGIIVLWWLIIEFILSFVIGFSPLISLEFSQTIVIFILSLLPSNQNLREFVVWILSLSLDELNENTISS